MQRQKSNITLMRKAQSKRWYHLLAQVFQIPEMVNHMYVAETIVLLEPDRIKWNLIAIVLGDTFIICYNDGLD